MAQPQDHRKRGLEGVIIEDNQHRVHEVTQTFQWNSDFFFFNWIVVDLQCCVSFWHIAKQLRYILLRVLFHYGLSKILNIVPCAIRRTLLFIHSIYNSLYLLIPDSHTLPPCPLATTSMFPIPENMFLFYIYIHLCSILDFTYVWYHIVLVSLSDLLHLVW